MLLFNRWLCSEWKDRDSLWFVVETQPNLNAIRALRVWSKSQALCLYPHSSLQCLINNSFCQSSRQLWWSIGSLNISGCSLRLKVTINVLWTLWRNKWTGDSSSICSCNLLPYCCPGRSLPIPPLRNIQTTVLWTLRCPVDAMKCASAIQTAKRYLKARGPEQALQWVYTDGVPRAWSLLSAIAIQWQENNMQALPRV